MENKSTLVIAGPCALESREQLKECVQILKPMGIKMIRASLWKPRTLPGWEGMGSASLQLLLEETLPHGLIPATEILCAEHALMVIHALEHYGQDARIIVWIGARNQNHLEQRKISRILSTGPEGITFMFKNQVWDDERHWLGIAEHILAEGFPRERLMICHRGFSPGKASNHQGLRNLPDFEMAMRVKEKTGLPMLLDPSHIGGTQDNVMEICHHSLNYNFDGYLIEMHPNPEVAKTDAKQQLSPHQLGGLLKSLSEASCKKAVA